MKIKVVESKYTVRRYYEDEMKAEKSFNNLSAAVQYCLDDDKMSREDGHALSVCKNEVDSIFEINYYGNAEVNVSGNATDEELSVIRRLTESKQRFTEAADIRKYRVFSTFPEWLQKIESLNLDLRGIDPVCIALELAYRCENRGYGPMRLPSAKAVKDNYYAGAYASRLLQDYEGFNGLSWGLTPEDEKYDEYADRYSKENVDNDAREMIQYIINSAKADTFNKWLN